MTSTDSIKDQTKSIQNESHILQIDTSDTILDQNTENNKTQQENENYGEIVVKIGSFRNVKVHSSSNVNVVDSLRSVKGGREFMEYGYSRQKHVPTTWVYFQQAGNHIPSDGGPPLDYEPDRNSFVRLVFILLFIMIACTAAINAGVLMVEDLRDIFKEYGLIFAIASIIIMVSLNYAMACCACTRMVPWNYICLVIAVIGMSLICCYVTVRYDTTIVLLAVLATAGVVLVCVLLACSRFDFTKWYLYAVVISAAFSLVALIVSLYMLISGNYIKILHLVMLCVGTAIACVILVMELQMILGGKTIELSEDDYALGAYLLYTSIIDIFLKLVQILGIADDM